MFAARIRAAVVAIVALVLVVLTTGASALPAEGADQSGVSLGERPIDQMQRVWLVGRLRLAT